MDHHPFFPSVFFFFIFWLMLHMFLQFIFIFLTSYNPALPMQPPSWSVPPRAQSWYAPQPPIPVPPAPTVLPPQPLFPIQNVTPLTSTTAPGLQPPFQVGPPGLPSSTPPSVSHPLFPITSTSNTPAQSSPFLTSTLPATIASSSPTVYKGAADLNSISNTSATSGYPAQSNQGKKKKNILVFNTCIFLQSLVILFDRI